MTLFYQQLSFTVMSYLIKYYLIFFLADTEGWLILLKVQMLTLQFTLTLLGDRAHGEMVKLKWGHMGRTFMWHNCCIPLTTQKDGFRKCMNMVFYQPEREFLPYTPDSYLILDFSLQNTEKSLHLGYPVMIILAYEHSRWNNVRHEVRGEREG